MSRRARTAKRDPEDSGPDDHAELEAETRERIDELMGDREEIPDDWRDLVEDRLTRLLGRPRDKGAEDRKTLDEVFDKPTLLLLYKLMSGGVLDTLDYPVSTGKEANVFHATTRGGDDIAVKIFRTNTATFRSFMGYIEGDPRFGSVGRDRRDVVSVWTQKEYKNLERYYEAGVRVPRPITFRGNVLVMEFVGNGGTPAPRLKDAPPQDPDAAYRFLVADYARGYAADLVHGDFSEFNILNHGGELVTIDVAQAVLTRHPQAGEFLERDARNLARYFKRLGVKDATPEATLKAFRQAKAKRDDTFAEEAA